MKVFSRIVGQAKTSHGNRNEFGVTRIPQDEFVNGYLKKGFMYRLQSVIPPKSLADDSGATLIDDDGTFLVDD